MQIKLGLKFLKVTDLSSKMTEINLALFSQFFPVGAQDLFSNSTIIRIPVNCSLVLSSTVRLPNPALSESRSA